MPRNRNFAILSAVKESSNCLFRISLPWAWKGWGISVKTFICHSQIFAQWDFSLLLLLFSTGMFEAVSQVEEKPQGNNPCTPSDFLRIELRVSGLLFFRLEDCNCRRYWTGPGRASSLLPVRCEAVAVVSVADWNDAGTVGVWPHPPRQRPSPGGWNWREGEDSRPTRGSCPGQCLCLVEPVTSRPQAPLVLFLQSLSPLAYSVGSALWGFVLAISPPKLLLILLSFALQSWYGLLSFST